MSMNTIYLQDIQSKAQEKFKEIDERLICMQETEINDYECLLQLINDLQKDNERLAQRCRKLEEDNFTLYNKLRQERTIDIILIILIIIAFII